MLCEKAKGLTIKSMSFDLQIIKPSLQAFQTHLKEEGISYAILQDLSTLAPDVFYGLSIAIDDPEDLAKLKKSAHVQVC